tara:strand:+ start:553 stop:1137 length:585 start_codon:yes stop_codon:yes gene_type:complete
VKNIHLILASSSSQRLELLKQIDIFPDKIVPAKIEENPNKGEKPRDFVIRMSKEKALNVSKKYEGSYVLSGDTIVSVGRRIIGKPSNKEEAEKYLNLLSGRRHRVLSAVTLITPENKEITKVTLTRVKFSRLNKHDLLEYIKTNEWKGRAGGYAIQGKASAFIPWINGSYTGIVGFPINEVKNLLSSSGWKFVK